MAAGNLAIGRALTASRVRTKAQVSHPRDPDEEEADRVADAIAVNKPLPPIGRTCPDCIGRSATCSACEAEERARQAIGSTSMATSQFGGGQPLSTEVRSFFELQFARDLADVRVHTGARAAESARALNARAYAIGNDIVFGHGEYSPGSTSGRRLLAHELTHVLQASLTPRVRRQPAAPAAGDAASAQVEPAVPAGTECTMADGYRFCANREQVRFMVRKMVKERGMSSARGTVDRMLLVAQGGLSPSTAHGSAAGKKIQSPADVAARLRRNDPAELAAGELDQLDLYVTKFGEQADAMLLKVLEESEKSAKIERTRYGLEGQGGARGSYSMQDNQSTQLLIAAAQDLLEKNATIGKLVAERSRHVRYAIFPEVINKAEYARLSREIDKAQREFDVLATSAKMRYPVLAAVLENRGGTFGGAEAMQRLGALAGGGKSGAAVLGWLIDERLENIEKVRKAFNEGHIRSLKVPKIVGLTKLHMQIRADSVESRVVDDKVSTIVWTDTLQSLALAVVALALGLIAAIPSGGSSLVAAGTFVAAAGAGALSGYVLAQSIREYEIESASARTDLDRAQAISASDPSLFWLALDVVGVMADVGAAAKAFKSLVKVVREALTVKTAVEAADSARAIKQVAGAQAGATAELGERVAASVERVRGGGAGTQALGVAGEKELGAIEKGGKQAAKELAGDVVTSAIKSGGEIKLTASGWLFSCASPCAVLREKYVLQLAADNQLSKELAALEAAAEKAGTNAAKRKEIADAAGALEDKLRKVTVGGWESPIKGRSDYQKLLKQRGTAAFELNAKPPGWTGAMEADFRYGKRAEPGYRWVLQEDGKLRYDRLSRDVPQRHFDIETGTFKDVPPRASSVVLESEEQLLQMAQLGKGAASRAEWLGRIRNGIPECTKLTDAQLSRVLAHSPNLDHMRGALLEELAGQAAVQRAKTLGKGVEYISPDRIRDAAKAQLTDGMFVRKRPDGSYEVVAFVESKAGEASARELGATRKSFNSLSEGELAELRAEAIEEFRVSKGLDPDSASLPGWATTENVLKNNAAEIEARMRDIHTADMGQVRKSFERLMPGANNRPVTVNIDGIGEVPVHVSPSKTTVFTVTPSDVSAQKTAAQLGTEGLNVQALDVGVSSERLDSVARQLRAEAVKNAPGTAQ